MHIAIRQSDLIHLFLNETEKDVKDILLSIVRDREDITWSDDGFFEMSVNGYKWLYEAYNTRSDDVHDERSVIDVIDELKTYDDKMCQTDRKVSNTISTQTTGSDILLHQTAMTGEDHASKYNNRDNENHTVDDESVIVRPMDVPILHNGLRRQQSVYTTSDVSAPSVMSGYDLSAQPHTGLW